MALRAFDELADQYPDAHLVLAGRKGWIEDDTVATITGHPSYGERVHWIQSPSDALLAELYRRATACLYLSRYEGYGLPIAEALAHGRVTVASYGSGMPEVGGDSCDYVWHNVVPEVVETLAQYLGDPDLLEARERHIREKLPAAVVGHGDADDRERAAWPAHRRATARRCPPGPTPARRPG